MKGRGGGHHQEGERLWSGGSETFLLAILDMISIDAIDGIQQFGVLHDVSERVACQGRIQFTLCPAITILLELSSYSIDSSCVICKAGF